MSEVQGRWKMFVVCSFLGYFGIHRKMMGYSNWWVQLVTVGGCGVWAILDWFKLLTGSMTMANGEKLA